MCVVVCVVVWLCGCAWAGHRHIHTVCPPLVRRLTTHQPPHTATNTHTYLHPRALTNEQACGSSTTPRRCTWSSRSAARVSSPSSPASAPSSAASSQCVRCAMPRLLVVVLLSVFDDGWVGGLFLGFLALVLVVGWASTHAHHISPPSFSFSSFPHDVVPPCPSGIRRGGRPHPQHRAGRRALALGQGRAGRELGSRRIDVCSINSGIESNGKGGEGEGETTDDSVCVCHGCARQSKTRGGGGKM